MRNAEVINKRLDVIEATLKPEEPVLAPLTKEQRIALLPKYEEFKLVASPEQEESFLALLHTDHWDAAVKIITQAAQGTVSVDHPQPGIAMTRIIHQLAELKPESYLESMLLAQMIQVSNAAGNCMERAFLNGQTMAGKELNANLALKFQRTFVAQIEALQKLRGKGGQKVTVEHVHVHDGGQAIVGNVNHAPGGRG